MRLAISVFIIANWAERWQLSIQSARHLWLCHLRCGRSMTSITFRKLISKLGVRPGRVWPEDMMWFTFTGSHQW